jgi:hypothetical protein
MIPEGGGYVRPLFQNSRGTLYRAVFRPWRWNSRASGEIEPRRMQWFPIGSRGVATVFFGTDVGYVQRPVQIASGVQTIRITTSLRALGMSGTGMGQTLIDEGGGTESGMATLGYIALGAGALYLLAKK